MLQNFRSHLAFATAIGLALAPSVAHSQASSTSIDYGLSGPWLGIGLVNILNPAAPISLSFSNGAATSQVAAAANFGILRSYASGHVPPSSTLPPDSWAGTLVRSTWNDTVTISSPGLDGQAGSARVSLTYSWNLALTDPSPAGSFAQGSAKLAAGGYAEIGDALLPSSCGVVACPVVRSAVLVGSGIPPTSVATGPGTLYLDFGFTFGAPLLLSASLTAYAYEYGTLTSAGDALADASHTAVWGGFAGVESAAGPVAFSVSSASGFDYEHAAVVPETGTAALLLFGLFAICVRQAMRPALRADR